MIEVGDEVGWLWIGSLTTGFVLEIHPSRHEIISKGKHIARNGSKDDPSLVIRHKNGSLVLKLLHEVQKISSKETHQK